MKLRKGGSDSDAVSKAHRRTKSMMEVEDISLHMALSKKDRCEYFNKNLEFIEELGRISDRLRLFPVPKRRDFPLPHLFLS